MNLYKYIVPDRTDILENETIRFTQLNELNDPFEASPVCNGLFSSMTSNVLDNEIINHFKTQKGIEGIIEATVKNIREIDKSLSEDDIREIVSREVNKSLSKEMLEITSKVFINEVKKTFIDKYPEFAKDVFNRCGVLCLTEKPDNRVMWGNYADSNRGFVLRFDSQHPFFDQRIGPNDFIRQCKKIKYTSDRPEATFLKLEAGSEGVSALVEQIYFTKHYDWQYEEEWRIVLPLNEANNYMNAKNNIYLFTLPPDCINGVIFGEKMSNEKKEIIKNILKQKRYCHVELYQAKSDAHSYKINIEPLEKY